MSEWKARRFWKKVDVQDVEGGFQILLDERVLKTPGKKDLVLPTQPLAEAVAQEWRDQGDMIMPQSMPMTRAVNSTIEKVIPQFDAVAQMLAEYGGSDLLCYRATDPQQLVARQAEHWDPLIAWAAQKLQAPLQVTQGVMHVAQNAESLTRLREQVFGLDPWGLTALHDLVTLPGSLVLGLAVVKGHLDAAQAHGLSRIDEMFQAERWGADEEAEQAAQGRHDALLQAERLWRLSRTV